MRRQIVAVRMSNGTELRHIAGCAYVYHTGSAWAADAASVDAIITDINNGINSYFTCDYRGDVAAVATVRHSDGTYYLRTRPDATQADNLLRLPRYGG